MYNCITHATIVKCFALLKYTTVAATVTLSFLVPHRFYDIEIGLCYLHVGIMLYRSTPSRPSTTSLFYDIYKYHKSISCFAVSPLVCIQVMELYIYANSYTLRAL
jgi:hypothetical protein